MQAKTAPVRGLCSPTMPDLLPSDSPSDTATRAPSSPAIRSPKTAHTGAVWSVASSSVSSTPITQAPALTVAKTVTSTGPYALNSVISYSVVATNSGTVTLNNVVVSDPLLAAPNSITCATVAPGEARAEHVVQMQTVLVDLDHGDIAGKFRISGIPAVLIFKGGAEVGRLVGLQPEAAFDKALRAGVEFAQNSGILSPIGKRDHAVVQGRGQAGGALVDPFAPLGLGQRIHVEHYLPFGSGRAIAFQRSTPHQAARVRLILPEIIKAIRAKADKGDAVFAVIYGQRIALQFLEARIAG